MFAVVNATDVGVGGSGNTRLEVTSPGGFCSELTPPKFAFCAATSSEPNFLAMETFGRAVLGGFFFGFARCVGTRFGATFAESFLTLRTTSSDGANSPTVELLSASGRGRFAGTTANGSCRFGGRIWLNMSIDMFAEVTGAEEGRRISGSSAIMDCSLTRLMAKNRGF